MRYVLFLDDRRHPADVIPGDMLSRYHSDNLVLIWATTPEMAKWYVEDFGLPEFVWFDHDLGEKPAEGWSHSEDEFALGEEITAMQWLNWLRDETRFIQNEPPFGYMIQSSNPVGQQNIMSFMDSWVKVWAVEPCEDCQRKFCVCNDDEPPLPDPDAALR